MYLIDRLANRISKVEKKTFAELKFRERDHLQEWLANYPDALGEEILIIQKEFNGFNDTMERLDLLGLDKQGNIVVIENKLDDTGRDVTWQVLKYASYCSTLKKEQIREIYQSYLTKQGKDGDAVQNLEEFFGRQLAEVNLNSGQTQRIILIAGDFRKEVTSTVLWLLNYKLRIQCFKVTPFQMNDMLFLNIEQIIPMKEAEEYVISMAEKTQEEISTQEELKSRHYLRLDFWRKLLDHINKQSPLLQSVSPIKESWLATGSGISGVIYNFAISNSNARVEFYMSKSSKEENKFIFDELLKCKDQIEANFGSALIWDRSDDIKTSRIRAELGNVNYFNQDDWQKMIEFMVDAMIRLERTIKEYIPSLKVKLKDRGAE